jgi:UDP-glucose:(heptosyl)LPS alpha-1,3-glucosyltransferase
VLFRSDVYQPRGGSYPEALARNIASFENKFIEFFKKLTSFANLRRNQFLKAEKKICRNSHGPVILALSRYVADHFKDHYKLADDRIAVIPNGIKIDKHADPVQTDHLKARVLSQLGRKQAQNPVFFLFVANNFRLKGLSPLLKAMQIAGRDKFGKHACLLVAGSGPNRQFQKLAKKLNIHNNVTFLGPLGHIQNALALADIAILPTFYDPASRFILEALAAGLPVITTKFNGSADFFQDPRHGKIINDPSDISALAAAICHFANPQNIRSAAQNIAADNLKQNIDIDRAAGQLDLLYDSIINSRRKQ